MIDEAQRLNARVLEEIRLLSNFETDQAKLLQIVLVGQPDLDDVLRRADMRQLNQRVARRCELYPLSESEVGDYIERRLTVAASPAALAGASDPSAGSSTQLVRFSPDAVRVVAQISEGIPRVVNTLCDRALDVAYERQIRVVDADAVAAAASRLQLDVPGAVTLPGGRRVPRFAAAAAAGIIAVAGLGWWWTSRPAEPTRDARQTATGASAARTPGAVSQPGSTTPPPTPREAAPPSLSSATAAGSQRRRRRRRARCRHRRRLQRLHRDVSRLPSPPSAPKRGRRRSSPP
jgi:general secretion pathway protein A